MRFNELNNRLRWGIIGGFLGGLIAVIGFGIFTILGSPPSDTDLISVITQNHNRINSCNDNRAYAN